VDALRRELEQQQRNAQQAMNQLQSGHRLETQQLQAAVDQLRLRLEELQADHEAELQQRQSQMRIQLGELQQALVVQRQLLEAGAEAARP
jgi:hypothetical protein